jgi:hypothetical protein
MIRFRIFLFVILLVLFFFSLMVPTSNGSSTLAPTGIAIPKPIAAPALAYTPEPYITVTMYTLDSWGNNTGGLCSEFPDRWGCTAFCTNSDRCIVNDTGIYPYPYDTAMITVPVQTYYLLDVVSAEMNPAMVTEPQAVRAQAVASRSYVWYHIENTILSGAAASIDNSNGKQVFVPHLYDALFPKYLPLEPTIADPCDPLIPHSPPQQRACDAVAPRHYLSRWNTDAPAFAAFASDIKTETFTFPPATPPHPELVGVKEPVSTACNAVTSGNPYGMSGNGAMRWARGHECSYEGAEPEIGNLPGGAWSVTWDRAEQILFHYFTRVHLRDADNGKQILSPNWRWNPLQIEWGTPDNQPPVLIAGQTRAVPIQIQNTSIDDWNCRIGDTPLSYRLRYRWLNGSTVIYTASTGLYMCNVLAGGAKNDLLQVYAPAGLSGTYTLRLDMYESFGNFWFSDGGWPPYDVTVRIIPPPSPTPTATPCGNDC